MFVLLHFNRSQRAYLFPLSSLPNRRKARGLTQMEKELGTAVRNGTRPKTHYYVLTFAVNCVMVIKNLSQLVKNVVANSTLSSIKTDGDSVCEIIQLSLYQRDVS